MYQQPAADRERSPIVLGRQRTQVQPGDGRAGSLARLPHHQSRLCHPAQTLPLSGGFGSVPLPGGQGQDQRTLPHASPDDVAAFLLGNPGFSYELNLGEPVGLPIPSTLKPVEGSLSGKTEGWVPDPTRFIVYYEPPATPQVCHASPPMFLPRWYQWHRNRGKTDFLDPSLAPGLFYSPILFVDGHAKFLNSTRALCADPYYPFEETTEWMWYKPAESVQ